MILRGAFISVLIFINQQVFAQKPYKCDRILQFDASKKGEIKSPGYDNGAYPNELVCEYKITAPEGYRIKITFLGLDIEPIGSCGHDRLILYGKNRQNHIGTFCGQFIPKPILSIENENEIEMFFITDIMVNGKGFHLQYEAAPEMDICRDDEGHCRNRNCYKIKTRCDGKDDCGDGTDEEDCERPVALPDEGICGHTPIKPSTIHGAPDRQVGGEAAVPNSWPWQVSLQYRDVEPNGHFCGGSLISPEWVVTAAHCIAGIAHPSDVRIVLGSHYKYQKTKYEMTRFAKRIIVYPDLEVENLKYIDLKHDTALIKLNAPVTFNYGIQPVCVPQLGWEAKPGWQCYSTGWGETRGTGFSDVLKQTSQHVQEDCAHDTTTQICVNKPLNSPCHGDSGGPLVCKLGGRWYLMGATSYATSSNFLGGLCGVAESRVIFAKIADKGDWIRKVIEIS